MLVGAAGRLIGSVGGGCVEADVIGAALEAQACRQPALMTHHLNADLAGDLGLSCGGTVDIFVEPVSSDEAYVRVLEAAAGAESGVVRTAVTRIAAAAGFRVVVIDDRREYADPARFENGIGVLVGDVDAALARYPLTAADAVVIA